MKLNTLTKKQIDEAKAGIASLRSCTHLVSESDIFGSCVLLLEKFAGSGNMRQAFYALVDCYEQELDKYGPGVDPQSN